MEGESKFKFSVMKLPPRAIQSIVDHLPLDFNRRKLRSVCKHLKQLCMEQSENFFFDEVDRLINLWPKNSIMDYLGWDWKCKIVDGKIKVYFHVIPPGETRDPNSLKKWLLHVDITVDFSKEYCMHFLVKKPKYKYGIIFNFEPRTEKSGLVLIFDYVRCSYEYNMGLRQKGEKAPQYLMRYEGMNMSEFIIRYLDRKNVLLLENEGWWEISEGIETDFSTICNHDSYDSGSEEYWSDDDIDISP